MKEKQPFLLFPIKFFLSQKKWNPTSLLFFLHPVFSILIQLWKLKQIILSHWIYLQSIFLFFQDLHLWTISSHCCSIAAQGLRLFRYHFLILNFFVQALEFIQDIFVVALRCFSYQFQFLIWLFLFLLWSYTLFVLMNFLWCQFYWLLMIGLFPLKQYFLHFNQEESYNHWLILNLFNLILFYFEQDFHSFFSFQQFKILKELSPRNHCLLLLVCIEEKESRVKV
jgi:hypothetical protein